MVMDALRGYVQLANGLTEVTKQRAQAAAKALVQQTGAETLTTGLTTKVSDLAEEIVATSKSNRQLLQAIVANEVEGAVAKLGFVRAEEVAGLARRIEKLEKELAEASKPEPAVTTPPIKKAPAKKAVPAKKTAAKKA
ncbi:polyhydroxyalkanoate synthesis protein PhaF [Kribbella deserti]|uniref:Polyhydroxyalkanoate synthesis protein PhaF n=1 Tax=Kribbella deserti TaxID=1926257 RepID=A0ABV6QRK0_9ACTN